jgi:hypothetical protein
MDLAELGYTRGNWRDHMFELKQRVVLVTGASRGIGKGIALGLGRSGATVAVNYRERGVQAEAVVEALRKGSSRASAFRADVSRATEVQSMVHDVEKKLGPIDILVNNAGMAVSRGLEEMTEEDFDRDIAVNLKSAFLCMQAVLPGMRARQWGRIVNVSSIGTHRRGFCQHRLRCFEGWARRPDARLRAAARARGNHSQCRCAGAHRHGDGQAIARGRRSRPHSDGARRNGRRNWTSGAADREQWLYDWSDDCGERRHAVFLRPPYCDQP